MENSNENHNKNSEKNRVKINIAGNEIIVRSTESEHYTERITARLNAEIRSVQASAPNVSVTSAVMLAALNICDSMTRAEEDADKLRSQIKEYLNDSAKYRSQYETVVSENEKLKNDIETYKRRLNDKKNETSAVHTARKVSSSEEAADEQT